MRFMPQSFEQIVFRSAVQDPEATKRDLRDMIARHVLVIEGSTTYSAADLLNLVHRIDDEEPAVR